VPSVTTPARVGPAQRLRAIASVYLDGIATASAPSRSNRLASATRSRSSASRPSSSRAANAFSVGPYQVRKQEASSSADRNLNVNVRSFEGEPRDAVEELAQVHLGAPEHRRGQAGRRRHVRGHGPEELADDAVGPPARERDRPARPQDAEHLGCGARLIGGEHRAEDRDDGVEGLILGGQRLGVGLHELEIEPLHHGAHPRPLSKAGT